MKKILERGLDKLFRSKNARYNLCIPAFFICLMPFWICVIVLLLSFKLKSNHFFEDFMNPFYYHAIDTTWVILIGAIYQIAFVLCILGFDKIDEVWKKNKEALFIPIRNFLIIPFCLFFPMIIIINGYINEVTNYFVNNSDNAIAYLVKFLRFLTIVIPLSTLVLYDTLSLLIYGRYYSNLELKEKIEALTKDLEKEKIKSNLYQTYLDKNDKKLRALINQNFSPSGDNYRYIQERPFVEVLKINKEKNIKLYEYFHSFFTTFNSFPKRKSYLNFLVMIEKIFEKIDMDRLKWHKRNSCLDGNYTTDNSTPLIITNDFFSLPENAISVAGDYNNCIRENIFLKHKDSYSFEYIWPTSENLVSQRTKWDWEHVGSARVLAYGKPKDDSFELDELQIKDIFIIPENETEDSLSVLMGNVFYIHKEENGDIYLLLFYDYQHYRHYVGKKGNPFWKKSIWTKEQEQLFQIYQQYAKEHPEFISSPESTWL